MDYVRKGSVYVTQDLQGNIVKAHCAKIIVIIKEYVIEYMNLKLRENAIV
jgi:hypothetical protein